MKHALPVMLFLMLCACQPADEPEPEAPEPQADETQAAPAGDAGEAAEPDEDAAPAEPLDRLGRILDAQPDAVQARYDARHPRQTLEFFGIEPGMTVVEGLPGGGWYTRILLPYLGSDGHLIGANYALELWPNFEFATEEFMAEMRQWQELFPEQAAGWCEDDCAEVSAFWLGSLPDELAGTADAALFIRALHNLAYYDDEGNYLTDALADAYAALKPGGILGVVQHEARPDMPDDWADGSNGYLKKQFVVDRAEAAGFELIAQSNINANPNDHPTTDEYVWRLPPSLRLEEEDPELEEEYRAIGESNRMTLRFRKPVQAD